MKLDEILNERKSSHGSFEKHAEFSQELKKMKIMSSNKFSHVQCEALDMIFHKLARILAGNPNYADHWVDIAGYAQLVVKELEKEKS